MHGLSIETYNKIKDILNKYPECEFKLFGSRAKGTYKYNSDIDLAIMNCVSGSVLDEFKTDLYNIDIIYKIDLVIVKDCTNDKLIQNIINEGVDF
ncbi:MAG: nucleotidyltransferase domain-containing protein [Clostridia bacterium]|nr:nucleotidyltransferase domain-containing protein [Clostridia bacterium]